MSKAVGWGATPSEYPHLAFVATARIGDTVVRLDHFCGELSEQLETDGLHDAATCGQADQLMKRIQIAARSSNLQVRAGIVEPGGARS